MNNINSLDLSLCCGCGSCESICSQNCIEMTENFEGFLYPKVDESKCVNCELCISHCPIVRDQRNLKILNAYGFIHNEEKILNNSSSGGAFSVFAEYILNNNGVIYGCEFDEDFQVSLKRVTRENQLDSIRGSKYIQCNNLGLFKNIKKDLLNNKLVLFTSVPCFVAGLKAYLNKDFENLYTVDLLCRGVPSQKLFNKYIHWLEKRHKGKIQDYKFRVKDYGWGTNGHYIINNKVHRVFSDDPFYNSFLKNKAFRTSCYECKYSANKRTGDVSIGDFWGIENFYPEYEKNSGVSAILTNSIKGEKLVSSTSNRGILFKSDFNKVFQYNKKLIDSFQKPKERLDFYKKMNQMDFNYFIKKEMRSESIVVSTFRRKIPLKYQKYLLKFFKLLRIK